MKRSRDCLKSLRHQPNSPETLINSPNNCPRLLDEIWCQIFSHLSANDRASIRLTCRHFRKLCDDIRVRRNEETIFHGDLNTGPALQLLLSSDSRIRNIRLHGVTIMDSFLPFFEARGGDLHSLIFEKCIFGSGLLRGILERCKALQRFVLILGYFGKKICPHVLEDLRALNENSITLDQVVDLKLSVYVPSYHFLEHWEEGCGWINQIFLQFMALFPNIKNVDLEFPWEASFTQLRRTSPDIWSADQLLSRIYDHILALRNQLERLRLYFKITDLWGSIPPQLMEKITQIEMQNLRELSLNWGYCSRSLTSNPFRVFKKLTHFHCDFQFDGSISPPAAVQRLLNTIPELRTLSFKVDRFPMSKQCFEAFVRSGLTKLDIDSEILAEFDESEVRATLQPNFTLRHLSIHAYPPSHSLFASYFQSLEHIIFLKVDERTLHNIFKHQNNLRGLSLYNVHKGGRFRDYNEYQQFLQNGDLSQNRQLPYLTHLHVVEDEVILTNFLLREFEFPRLKSLTIRIEGENNINSQFWETLSTIKQLEFLKLDFECDNYFQQLLLLVRSLPNLRHIQMPRTYSRSSKYLQLFKERPSLRTVVDSRNKYFYDVTIETIKNIPNKMIYHTRACEGIPHHYEYHNKCWSW